MQATVFYFAWLTLLAGCAGCGSVPLKDGGAADASVDGGDAGGSCLLECPPRDWADGGFHPSATVTKIGRPTNRFFSSRINNLGTVFTLVGSADGGEPFVLAQRDGGFFEVAPSARDVLPDSDAYIDCPQDSQALCFRRRPNGDRFGAAIQAFDVVDVTTSGWVSGQDIGTKGGNVVIAAPDGGRWEYPSAYTPLVGFSEQGVGVGQSPETKRLRIWRNGVSSTLPLHPPATSDWANDINSHGMIGGQRLIGGRNRAAVFWDNEVVDLPLRKGDSAEVLAVNDNNIAVGVEWDSSSSDLGFGFVWAGGSYYLLDELVPDAGCTIVRATDVNNLNEIAARAQCIDGLHVVRISLK